MGTAASINSRTTSSRDSSIRTTFALSPLNGPEISSTTLPFWIEEMIGSGFKNLLASSKVIPCLPSTTPLK